MELLVQRNIEGVIDRLKYLETKKCRREMTKEEEKCVGCIQKKVTLVRRGRACVINRVRRGTRGG